MKMAPRTAFGLLCFSCCYFLLLFSYTTTAQTTPSLTFNVTDQLFINCGTSGNTPDAEKRNWQGDIGSKFLLSNRTSSFEAQALSQRSGVPRVPFMTARIFTSSVTYSIPVAPERKFVRLYFYPSSYGGRNDSSAVFDVDSGEYMLLRNFTPAWDIQALNVEYIVREYSLNVSASGFVNLTFTPSPRYPGSYAFVNGIEVISMPDIFTPKDPLAVVGFGSTPFPLNPTTALETMYRLNVGGAAISRSDDAGGLFRQWEIDDLYIFGAAFGLTRLIDPNITLRYPSATPRYIAPDLVYTTQRSMTGEAAINKQSNLTWSFNVDPGFYYLMRLYFCDIQSIYNKPNERVFSIFINNMTAENQADVFAWATLLVGSVSQGSGLGVPYYKDYITFLPNGPIQTELRLDLRPNDFTKPEFVDAVLNGLEVFKLHNISGKNLAGVRPSSLRDVTVDINRALPRGSKGGSKTGAIAGGVVGSVVAVCLVGLVLFVLYKRKRQVAVAQPGPQDKPKWAYKDSSTLLGYSSPSSYTSGRSSLPSNLCRHFTLAEIEDATQGWDDGLILGVGGFGKVYRGVVRSNESMAAAGGKSPSSLGTATQMEVAIKRANPMSEQGVREFLNEIEMLSKLRHRHLVSLIGFCDEQGEMILVYDYMSNGTLREHLYNKTGKPTLGWRQRLDICIGAARGLHYLHTGARQTIIHRDVKTTNILLDESWVAKVSDFGLSKFGPEMEQQNTHVSTVVKGSFGYLDPEYFRRQQLTEKSDVYSFGVVLFEVICSRPALDSKLPKEQVSLAEWARYCYRKGVIEDIMDPRLKGKIAPKCFAKFVEVAEKCVSDRGTDRPSMGDVLWSLEFALQQQESTEKDGPFEGVGGGDVFSLIAAMDSDKLKDTSTTTANSTNSVSLASIDSDGLTPSTVFSQIMDPKGR